MDTCGDHEMMVRSQPACPLAMVALRVGGPKAVMLGNASWRAGVWVAARKGDELKRGRTRWQSRQAQTPQTPGGSGPDMADVHAKLKRVLANAAEERGKAAALQQGAAATEGSLPLNLCGNEAEKRRICNLLNARKGDYPCGLLICDAMERGVPVVYANGYFEDATGYAQHEILGRPYNFAQRRGVYATAEHELVDRATSAELATALQKVGVAWNISGPPPTPRQPFQPTIEPCSGYRLDVGRRLHVGFDLEKLGKHTQLVFILRFAASRAQHSPSGAAIGRECPLV